MTTSATVSSGGWLWCLDQLQCALEVGSGVYSTSTTVCSGGWLGCLDQLQCVPEVDSGV